MATAQILQNLQHKVSMLTDEQIRLLEEFADLLSTQKRKEEARIILKRLLDKRTQTMSPMSDDEAMQLAIEAVAWARGKAV